MKKKMLVFAVLSVLAVTVAGCAPGTVVQISTPDANTPSGTPAPSGEITIPGATIQINAPNPNPMVGTPNAQGRVAGILMGIWHGIISPATLVVSFVNSNFQMYEVHNDGSQYNLGFLIGVAIVFLLLGVFAGRRRR